MQGRARWAACALLLACARAGGAEPDGAVILRAAWEDADHLRVTVQSVASLDHVAVSWTGSHGLVVKVEGAPAQKAVDPIAGGERVVLESLAAGSLRTFRLSLAGTRGEGASPIVVRVEAMLAGQPVREALGIPVGTSGGGRLRGDVVEFDATVQP